MTHSLRRRAWRWLIPGAIALGAVIVGLRLGFERVAERLPYAVMPEAFRALPLPSTFEPIDDGCEMAHVGVKRRYACRFSSVDDAKTALARLAPTLEANGWRASNPQRFARADWAVSVRTAPASGGLTEVRIALTRGFDSDD